MGGRDGDQSPRGPKETHRLTPYERKYLETDTVAGSYSESDYERMVRAKIELFPSRLEELHTDTALLNERGYLAGKKWRQTWLELLSSEEEDLSNGDGDGSMSNLISPNSRRQALLVEFGKRMGRTLNHLLPPELQESDDVRQAILWGIVEEFYMTPRLAGEVLYEGRTERRDDLIEMLEKRTSLATEADKPVERGIDQEFDRYADWEERQQAMESRVHEVLTDDKLATQMSDSLADHLSDTDATLDVSELAEQTVGYLIAELVDVGTPGTYGQWKTFMEQYDHTEFDIETVITSERVLQIIDEYRLVERQQLKRLLQQDADRIDRMSWHDANATEVLEAVFTSPGAASREIAADLGIPEDTSAVTTLARDISANRQRELGEIWKDRPLVEGDREGWSPTTYGAALSHYLFQYNRFMPFSAIADDVVEPTLDAL